MILLLILLLTPYQFSYTVPEPIKEPIIEERIERTISETLDYYSDLRGLDKDLIRKIAFCESSLNEKAIGDQNRAFGLFQIHISLHNVSKECALNADCSTDWATKQIAQGRGRLWTCWRTLALKDK